MSSAHLAILGSVAMHVTWNLIARYQPHQAQPLWWVLLAHLLLIAPWGWWQLFTQVQWSWELVLWLLASTLANICYFIGLKESYLRASSALIYPLVRSSPLLIAVWSWILLGEKLSPLAWVGILISIAGLLILGLSARGERDRAALPWALLAMLSTSVYSMTDKQAVSHLPDLLSALGYVSVGYLGAWLTLCVVQKRQLGCWWPAQRIGLVPMLVGGVCVGLAYALVVYAMNTLPSAVVVAYSNTGIVVAALISIFYFRERTHWQQRLIGAAVILVGIFFIQFY